MSEVPKELLNSLEKLQELIRKLRIHQAENELLLESTSHLLLMEILAQHKMILELHSDTASTRGVGNQVDSLILEHAKIEALFISPVLH